MTKSRRIWGCRERPSASRVWIRVTRLTRVACLVTFFSFAALAVRGDVLIDFEGFTAMGNSPGAAVPAASQVSTQFLATDGVLFESGSLFIAAVNLGVNHATSGSKGIGGVTAAGTLSYSTPIDAEFFLPGDPATAGVTDFVSVRGDQHGVGGLVTLQAFDIHGLLLDTNTQLDSGGPTLQISTVGIHSVSFFSATANVAFDDFTFGPVRAAPEPSSAASLGSGMLCLIGISRCRSRAR